jgi:hypothetical protein
MDFSDDLLLHEDGNCSAGHRECAVHQYCGLDCRVSAALLHRVKIEDAISQ